MKQPEDLLQGVRSATVSNVSVLVREVRVRVGVLSKHVTIRIYHHPDDADPYSFDVSAVMKPQGDREHGSAGRAASENEALRGAVRMLTQEYEDAVRRGEMPDDGWLVAAAQ